MQHNKAKGFTLNRCWTNHGTEAFCSQAMSKKAQEPECVYCDTAIVMHWLGFLAVLQYFKHILIPSVLDNFLSHTGSCHSTFHTI